jgi:hypothetical protein
MTSPACPLSLPSQSCFDESAGSALMSLVILPTARVAWCCGAESREQTADGRRQTAEGRGQKNGRILALLPLFTASLPCAHVCVFRTTQPDSTVRAQAACALDSDLVVKPMHRLRRQPWHPSDARPPITPQSRPSSRRSPRDDVPIQPWPHARTPTASPCLHVV